MGFRCYGRRNLIIFSNDSELFVFIGFNQDYLNIVDAPTSGPMRRGSVPIFRPCGGETPSELPSGSPASVSARSSLLDRGLGLGIVNGDKVIARFVGV
jgi:hypothetical protein